jgi:antitoxin CcdA
MRNKHREGPRKKAANLSIDRTLLKEARELGVNLSAVLEKALEEAVRRRLGERWLLENRAAIASYNDLVERQGVFSEGIRSF